MDINQNDFNELIYSNTIIQVWNNCTVTIQLIVNIPTNQLQFEVAFKNSVIKTTMLS